MQLLFFMYVTGYILWLWDPTLLFFPSRPCFIQCRSLTVRVIKGEFQAHKKRTLHTCFEISFHNSHMIYRILFWSIYHLSLPLHSSIITSLCISPLLTFCRQVIFFPLFDPYPDHPAKHLACRSWIPRSRQEGTDLWGILRLHLMCLEITDFNEKCK